MGPARKRFAPYGALVRAGAKYATGAAANYALNYAARRFKSKLRARYSSQPESTPLTGQYDYKVDYRKRRLGYRKRRAVKRRYRWRRKVVNTVRNANTGTTHIVRRSLFELLTTSSTSDAVTFGLYGQNGTTGDLANPTADIREMFREISETDWQDMYAPGVNSRHHKIYSMHATMEMTIRNVGETDALIEAYYIRGTKATPGGFNPTGIYAESFNKAGIAVAPNTGNVFDAKLSFTTVGTTPFQAPWFCQHFKVTKRVKFRVPPGNEINLVIHDPKPRTFDMALARMRSTDKSYSGILFQQQGSPSTQGDVDTLALPTTVTYLSIRRYRIKMLRDDLDMTALDSSGA